MTLNENSLPILNSVLYPSDFTEGTEVAFAHALKISLVAQSELTLIHVATEDQEEWNHFPGVRDTLVRWGLLAEDSPRSAVPELGIHVRKVMAHAVHPVHAVLKYQEKHPADLIVLASHPQEGITNWFHESMAEPVARESGAMTLFVPSDKEGFVSRVDGSVNLRHILIPIAEVPDPQVAIDGAARVVTRLGCPVGTFTVLHVGSVESTPAVSFPDVPGWTWVQLSKEGDVIENILGVAQGASSDLIIMATDGRDGFLDALRGSHSERVLRASYCPLLTLPVAKVE